MALVLKTNNAFMGDASALPSINAPLPKGASLYADFIRRIYINTEDGVVNKKVGDISNAFTLIRESGGSYISSSGGISYAAQNVPRYDADPSTGRENGLLMENVTTNQVRSIALDSASYYSTTGVELTHGDDGFYLMTVTPNNGSHFLKDLTTNTTVSSKLNGAISIYARKGTGRYLQIYAPEFGDRVYANYDLETGEITKTGRINQAQIERGIHGSWRCTLAFLTPTVNSVTSIRYAVIENPDAIPADTFTGVGESIALAFPQMELSQTFATSVMSPDSGDRTRNGEELYLKHNIDELDDFTIFISAKMTRSEQGAGAGNVLAYIYNSATSRGFSIGIASAQRKYPGALYLNVSSTPSAEYFPYGPRYFSGANCSLALRKKGDELSLFTLGNDIQKFDLSGIPGADTIKLGQSWGGWLQKCIFYPTSINDQKILDLIDMIF